MAQRPEGHGFTSHVKTRWTGQRSVSWAGSPVPHIASSMKGQMVVAVSAELRCLHRWTQRYLRPLATLCTAPHGILAAFKTETTARPALEGMTQKQALLLIKEWH